MKQLLITIAAVVLVGCGPHEKTQQDSLLETAVFSGDIKGAKNAINAGANVNFTHELTKVTPLHTAAAYNRTNIIELLLSNGANINQMSIRDGTPLDNAQKNAADLLRKHGGKTAEELEAEGK